MPSPETTEPAWTHANLLANGQRFHVVHQGEGPLVLLVHGFPEFWYMWRHQLPVLAAAGYHVVAADMRGCGRSSKPLRISDYRITEMVADCVGIVEALGHKQAVIVGHDRGATVAWTAAWTRPDVFRAVAGLTLPFAGRALSPVAGVSSLGEVKPSELYRIVAGSPDRLWYIEYMSMIGAVEAEFDADPRGFLSDMMYTYSADSRPADYQLPDVGSLDRDGVLEYLRSTANCLKTGGRWRDRFLPAPDPLPDWLAAEIDSYVEEFERTGLRTAPNWYRCTDLNWELLAPYQGRPVQVPALHVGMDDLTSVFGHEAIANMATTVPLLTESVILTGCGHWIQEKPTEVNEILLRFLRRIS
ncbi:MAG: alpha/beta hydrolase [Actinomycetota bacterium]|nr:MAG: alpha/beta hydrolase [Actinomycetota bacterium]